MQYARLKKFSTPLCTTFRNRKVNISSFTFYLLFLFNQQYLMFIESVAVILEFSPMIGNIFPLIGVWSISSKINFGKIIFPISDPVSTSLRFMMISSIWESNKKTNDSLKLGWGVSPMNYGNTGCGVFKQGVQN